MAYGIRLARIGELGSLSDELDKRFQKVESEIAGFTEGYLVQVNTDDLVGHLVSKYSVQIPTLDENRRSAKTDERMIRAELFPSTFNVRPGQTYPVTVVANIVPGEGELHWLGYRANKYSLGGYPDVLVSSQGVTFEIIAFGNNADRANAEIGACIRDIFQSLKWVQSDLQYFNDQLPKRIEDAVKGRKQIFESRNAFLDKLSVPIRVRTDAPPLHPVKLAVAKPLVAKPQAPQTKYEPTPYIDDHNYRLIIEALSTLARGLERLPSTYAGKSEEDLRDHLVLSLETRFAGQTSVTGETFNHTGKTDILIRHQGQNVFAAECKFWKGPKKLLETLDQLLGYLTWRDSKAALIIFDSQENFSKDLETIKVTVPTHPNHLKTIDDSELGAAVYEFCLQGDRGLVVTLTVMTMHFPKKAAASINKRLDATTKHQINLYRLTEQDRHNVIASAISMTGLMELLATLGDSPGVRDDATTFIEFIEMHDLEDQIEEINIVRSGQGKIKAKFRE